MAALDETRTGSLSIYHVECDIFIASSEELSQCKSCKRYRKTQSAMLSHRLKDQKTHPSSHTTYANLTTSEKDERLRNVQQENKKANLRVSQLKQKISDVASQGESHDECDHKSGTFFVSRRFISWTSNKQHTL